MSDWQILEGDCLDLLPTLEAGSVQACITSPPYWGLRDYGTGRWEGGDPGHAHDTVKARGGRGGSGTNAKEVASPSEVAAPICLCGAMRVDHQIGMEATPDEYVNRLVGVFREVRRVLRDDGTLWLNLGDSYAAGGHGGGGSFMAERKDAAWQRESTATGFRGAPPGLKPKDLVGIPWRVAFALQADGWYLRSDIIWAKPNPMPESVTDRPTKAHEYLFLLSKRERYYYDAKAIQEGFADARNVNPGSYKWSSADAGYQRTGGMYDGEKHVGWNMDGSASGRNRRTVWSIPTQPFPGAHFAVMPPALVDPCVLAGAPEGGMVLDPFAGAGTVGVVCRKHRRRFIGIELNPDYARMARGRLGQDVAVSVSGERQADWLAVD